MENRDDQRCAVVEEDTRDVYLKALENDDEGLREYFEKNPQNLFRPVTPTRDTVFHIAAYQGNDHLLEALLETVPSDSLLQVLEAKNIYGNTALHEAATAETSEAAKTLVQHKLRASSRDDDEHQYDQCLYLQETMVEQKNSFGETPLFKAASYGRNATVEYLVSQVRRFRKDVRSHFTRNDGLSILHVAILGQHFETAIWLLNLDGELASYKDKSGHTCLHLLADMPKAFYSTTCLRTLKDFAYKCLPNCSRDGHVTDHTEPITPVMDLESGINPIQNVEHTQGSRFLHAFSKGLVMNELTPKCIKEIYELKRTHELAVELAKILVKRDTSWFTLYQPKEDNTICLSRSDLIMGTNKSEPTVGGGVGGEAVSAAEEPETPLLVAARSGITEIFDEILEQFPQAIEHVNREDQNVLHVAILNRQYGIFDRLKDRDVTKTRLAREIDANGCTILHHAAETKYHSGRTRRATAVAMLQQERTWFKEVKDIIPSHYTMHRNKRNESAKELFEKNHKQQHMEAKKWVKGTSQSCSAVAVLVATVVFAAAFTVPGGNLDNSGEPVLLQKPMYSVFTVMDIAALATSLSSLVMFLSILTSSLELGDFDRRIPWQLSMGFLFLFSSVTTTMVAFTATIILTFKFKRLSAESLTYAAAFLPIAFYGLVQSPLYFELLVTAIRAAFDLVIMILPSFPSHKKRQRKIKQSRTFPTLKDGKNNLS